MDTAYGENDLPFLLTMLELLPSLRQADGIGGGLNPGLRSKGSFIVGGDRCRSLSRDSQSSVTDLCEQELSNSSAV